ncbi:hypothetical protein QEN19_004370 [Hanseniaspora menglaensis]
MNFVSMNSGLKSAFSGASSHRKYAFMKKYSEVREKIDLRRSNENRKPVYKYVPRGESFNEKEQKFNQENETYEQNFNQFLKDSAFLETQNDANNYQSTLSNFKDVPLNETSSVKIIFREFKNFSIYKYTPIDSNELSHKRIQNGEMVLEDGLTTKINPHKYVKTKLDQFLGENKPGRLTHQKTIQFLRGAGEGWNPKGKKLSVSEMEEIRSMKKEFDNEFADRDLNEESPPKFDYNGIARRYGISYEAVKRILATKGHYNNSPMALEKRLARDAKKAIEAAHYKVKGSQRK